MSRQPTLELAARIGARAGRSFVDSGIGPRCPFRHPVHRGPCASLAGRGVDVVGPMVRPVRGYWTRARSD